MLLKRLFSLAAAIFGLSQLPAYGLNPNGFEQGIHSGYVFARAIVKDKSGYPLWAEYNQAGGHTRIPVSGEQAAQSQVISGNTYRNFIKQYDDLKKLYNNQVELLPINQYNSFRKNNSLNSTLNQPIKNLPLLPADTKVVAIPALQHRGVTDGEQLVIKSFPVDLLNYPTINDNIQSLLIAENGEILYQSQNRIGYLTAFGTKKEGDQVEDSSEYKSSSISGRLQSFFAPIPGVSIESVTGYVNGYGVTDENGRYTTSYRVSPCPGFSYSPTVHSYTRLYYSNFNPRGKPTVPYYIQKQSYDLCDGRSAYINSTSIVGLMSHIDSQAATSLIPDNITRIDIPVAVHLVSGQVIFNNVEITEDRTTYTAEASPETLMLQEGLDYDGDGTKDRIVRGKINPDDGLFIDNAEGDLQGVYLSSNDRGDGKPNFTKLIDKQSHTTPQGLLKTISKADLANTDIYVFRESTGELITERVGLSDNEAKLRKETGISKNNNFYYQMMVRSPEDSFSIKRRLYDNWSDWQAKNKMNPALLEHKADHLRTGEPVRVIAINRATGYIGTALTTLGGTQAGGNITSPVPTIIMSPPNLKVWATRRYQPQGIKANSDAERHNIGNEGAALTSDYIIEVHTEWLDENDRPLPAELEGRGYTARLAKIVQDPSNSDDPLAASQIHEIAIDPGRRLQLVKFTEGNAGNFHYYFQVNGSPIDRENDFSSNPDHDGVLKYRPKTYVPLQVQLYDEKHTLARKAELQRLDKENEFEPIYHWVYRPELQFSVYDLEIDAIRRKTGDNKTVNIYGEKIPVISGSDNALEVAFDLISPAFNQLETIDGKREFVLAMGEQEYGFEVKREGSEQTIVFNNIEHLSEIEPEDYLTLRLFLNNDASNILWEYAFEYLAIDSRVAGHDLETNDTYYVTADDPVVPLIANLVGYAGRDEKDKKPLTIFWEDTANIGKFSPKAQTDSELGIFATDFTMPRTAGAKTVVKASLVRRDELSNEFKTVEVLPGKPHSVKLSTTGRPGPMGSSNWEVTAEVTDAHGNYVMDGTSVSFDLTGFAKLVSAETGTTHGKAKAVITGTEKWDDNIQLKVISGKGIAKATASSEPLTLNIVVDDKWRPGTTYPVEVTVTSASGKPVKNADVSLSSAHLIINNGLGKTNTQGQFTGQVTTYPIAGKIKLTARVGYGGVTRKTIDVDYGTTPSLTMADIEPLIGDQTASGTIQYQRYDNALIDLNYSISKILTLQGQAGESKTLTLGDVFDPNLLPTAAFYMNADGWHNADERGQFIDDTGRFRFIRENITLAADNKFGKGHSYRFENESLVRIPDADAIKQTNNTGFRVEIKPQQAGTLVNLAQGQSLQITNTGTLIYRVQTDQGHQWVESQPVSFNQWHTVSARFYQGKLELYVDSADQVYTTNAAGQIAYRGQQIKIGENYQGLMRSLRFYDWQGQPLVTTVEGDTQTAVTIDSNGKQTVNVVSAGRLHSNNSTLRLVRVAVTSGDNHHYLSLIDTESFKKLATHIADVGLIGPPIQYAAITDIAPDPYPTNILNYVVPQAHAGLFGDILGFFFPVEEFEVVIEQIGYLIEGNMEEFDAVALAMNAAIVIVDIVPLAKPLSPFMKVIKPFIAKPANRKFIKLFAGVIGDVTDKVVKTRSFKVVEPLLPFLFIVAEVLSDEEARQMIPIMVNAISSTEDFWSWVNYLALPTNGWEGDGLPPLVNLVAENNQPELPLSFLVDQAYASKSTKRKRAEGKRLGQMINEAFKGIQKSAPKNAGEVLTKTLHEVREAALDNVDLRQLVHKELTVKAGAAITSNKGRRYAFNLFRGRSNRGKVSSRIPMLVMMGVVAYLEDKMNGICKTNKCKSITIPKVKDKIRSLYYSAFFSPLNSGFYKNDNIGDQFHLAMIAVMHLKHEAGLGGEILAIEPYKKISLWGNQKGEIVNLTPKKQYGRYPDIVVANTEHEKPIWIEVKSIQGRKKPSNKKSWKGTEIGKEFTNKWKPWDLDSRSQNTKATTKKAESKYSYHKQYYLDKVASTFNKLIPKNKTAEEMQLSSGVEWYLQGFKLTTIAGPTPDQLKIVRNSMAKLPKKGQGTGKGSISLGYRNSNEFNYPDSKKRANKEINIITVKRWFLLNAKNTIFNGISDLVIDELVRNR
ncbi:hypothetical protein [Spartinivicinus poritis]|uniref:Uncharacterized protein n=1 Tax=Spartinivicinus poritis TaxID=2994640 RepID=A0ABT5U8J9_9GAMM|nr:hypothetical protein [Spartinivicinus sp. A2-2]MDE1462695.1 hypothetical protein [Spartinivicinus sp. A2-2]